MLTLSAAAEAVGMTKAGLLKAIKRGRVSAAKNHKGQWQIDPAELFRVYTPEKLVSSDSLRQETDTVNELTAVKMLLDSERQERERERRQLQDTIDDLRRRLDEESGQCRQLTATLTTREPKRLFFWKKEQAGG